jgi:hypothetical protein
MDRFTHHPGQLPLPFTTSVLLKLAMKRLADSIGISGVLRSLPAQLDSTVATGALPLLIRSFSFPLEHVNVFFGVPPSVHTKLADIGHP